MTIPEALQYRYATKKFDTTRPLERSHLHACLESARLAPSAYGLQPYRYIIVSDRALKEQLSPVCYAQPQIIDSAILIVGQARKYIDEAFIMQYVSDLAQHRSQSPKSLQAFQDKMIETLVLKKTQSEQLSWSQHQLYLSVGICIAQAACEKIDLCPMEGFSSIGVDSILNESSKCAYQSTVLLAAGYRDLSDRYLSLQKFRRSFSSLIHERS